MSTVKWTDEQKEAIVYEGNNILLSAAAGSGKTAVLVERVIRRLKQTGAPERILVSTFTRKAAAEMKMKIINALNEASDADPDNAVLASAALRSSSLRVSTIDSLCIGLVRENIDRLDVGALNGTFSIMSNEEAESIRKTASESVIEELHHEASPDFKRLNDMCTDDSGDKRLANYICRLSEFAATSPFPERFYQELRASVCDTSPIPETRHGKILIQQIASDLSFVADVYKQAISLHSHFVPDTEKSSEILAGERDFVDVLLMKIQALKTDADWDDFLDTIRPKKFERLNLKKGYENNPEDKDQVKSLRDFGKGIIEQITKNYIPATSAEHRQDMEKILPICNALIDATIRFDDRVRTIKYEKNSIGFSDVLHLAIRLLLEEDGVTRTEFCEQLRGDFDEIFIDEYQDTNLAQDTFFWALSNGKNRFMVGDAKQSIYGFRHTEPALFTDKFNSYTDDGSGDGRRLALSKNFRSDEGIINAANYIFDRLIIPEMGGIDYTRERLVHNDEREELKDNPVEVILYNKSKNSSENTASEAVAIADYIEKHLGECYAPNKNPADYGDFCVLCRKKKNFTEYGDELRKRGIPFVSDEDVSLLERPEIRILVSILTIVDNPSDDMALLSAMYSPVFAFTPDELTEIRLENKYFTLWQCVNSASKKSAKARDFLDRLSRLRALSSCMGLSDFIRRVVNDLAYEETAICFKGGDSARTNIRRFIEFSDSYDSSDNKDLHGFIRFLIYLQDSDGKVTAKLPPASANCVRLMTMHGSKGLEFPYVILASLNSERGDSEDGGIQLNKNAGIGIRLADRENLSRYETISSTAVKLFGKKEETAEHLRLLYVATTRAKHRLSIILPLPVSSTFGKNLSAVGMKKKFTESEIMQLKNSAEILTAAIFRHPDMEELRESYGKYGVPMLDGKANFQTVMPVDMEESPEEEPEEEANFDADACLLEKISDKASKDYAYSYLSAVPSKKSASRSDKEFNARFVATSKPSFLSDGNLTAAARGTAYHKFLELCDFQSLAQNPEEEYEKIRLSGKMTENELDVVSLDSLIAFVKSPVGEAAIEADAVYKELSFGVFMPAGQILNNCPKEAEDEKILVQGMADLVFVKDNRAVIVDYKTDNVDSVEELKDMYAMQLKIYRYAVGQVLEIPVEDTVLYSLRLSQTVEVV